MYQKASQLVNNCRFEFQTHNWIHHRTNLRCNFSPMSISDVDGRCTVQKDGEQTSLTTGLFHALWFAVLAHSELVCYCMVFLHQVKSASILSLPLPVMVFLWGSLSVPRPSKFFWVTIIGYTEVSQNWPYNKFSLIIYFPADGGYCQVLVPVWVSSMEPACYTLQPAFLGPKNHGGWEKGDVRSLWPDALACCFLPQVISQIAVLSHIANCWLFPTDSCWNHLVCGENVTTVSLMSWRRPSTARAAPLRGSSLQDLPSSPLSRTRTSVRCPQPPQKDAALPWLTGSSKRQPTCQRR